MIALRAIVPEGCPVVIGGGIVRDGIMGGESNDIDVWLPSNINITSPQQLQGWAEARFGAAVSIIFNGPENVEQEGEGYRDMSNHCVLEFTNARGFRINLMRTMTPWVQGEPQVFFRGVMRNFDIDLCMFFIAFPPESRGIHVPYVVMPQHLVDQLNSELGVMRSIRQFCWNSYRLETMSPARKTMRSEKMHAKLHLRPADGRISVIDIEPTVVSVSWIMSKIEYFPLPRLPVTMTVLAVDEEVPNAAPLPPPVQITANPRNGMSLQELRMGTNDRWIPGVIRPEVQEALNRAFARIQHTPDGHIAW
uniref:Poly A polymerase head domain-containing protein n=3 Tax=unclassified bacterial viruses TaxID=12333 RepID=A0AAU6W0L3_9VIRU